MNILFNSCIRNKSVRISKPLSSPLPEINDSVKPGEPLDRIVYSEDEEIQISNTTTDSPIRGVKFFTSTASGFSVHDFENEFIKFSDKHASTLNNVFFINGVSFTPTRYTMSTMDDYFIEIAGSVRDIKNGYKKWNR